MPRLMVLQTIIQDVYSMINQIKLNFFILSMHENLVIYE